MIVRDDDYRNGRTSDKETEKNTKDDVINAAFNLFSLSGRVEDYLLYKQIERISNREKDT